MSSVKSSVINLYDALSGDNHFQTKVSSDRVDLQVATLPLNLKGSIVSLSNEGGNQIVDVVETMLATQQSVVDEAAARSSAVSAEAALRVSGDADLQTAINQESSDRVTAMAAETVIRVVAENSLDVKITEEKGAREAAMTAEISARSGADTVLQTNLDSESVTRAADDTTLQSNLDSESAARVAAVLAELTARSSADATLQSNIDTEGVSRLAGDAVVQVSIDEEILDRQAAISAEESSRQSADASLQSSIDSEAATRLASDQTLQASINSETAARISAVSSEATARSDADNTLSASILAEQVARLAEVAAERSRIDAILDGSDVDLNQLKELVVAYTTSDDNILSQIAQINTTVTGIQSQLDGTDAALNTLIANIEATQAVVPTEYPTAAPTSGVYGTGAAPHLYDPLKAFDKESEIISTRWEAQFGYPTGTKHSRTFTTTSGDIVGGALYLDLQDPGAMGSANAVMTACEIIYQKLYQGLEFYIVGSNNATAVPAVSTNPSFGSLIGGDWTVLKHVTVDDSNTNESVHEAYNGNASSSVSLMTSGKVSFSNTTYYRYMGIMFTGTFHSSNTYPQANGSVISFSEVKFHTE